MSSRVFFTVALILLLAVIALSLALANSRYALQALSFDGTADKVSVEVGDFRVPLQGVHGIEVVGCQLTLAGVRVEPESSVVTRQEAGASVGPEPGQPMFVMLERGNNLDAKGTASTVDIEPVTRSAHGSGIAWTFFGKRTLNLFAEGLTLNTESLRWQGIDFSQPPRTVRLSTGQSTSLLLTCPLEDGLSSTRASLTLVLATPLVEPSSQYVNLDLGLSASRLHLEKPRGAVAIGIQTTTLGAGILHVNGELAIEYVQWGTTTRPAIEVSFAGLSRDIRLGDEQLAPSLLSEGIRSPAWTTFAAVMAIVASAFFSKWFDVAWSLDRQRAPAGGE